ncbi:MAG: hypothetical protein PSV17_11655 [Methylotenera sp.]|uniref:hypothetical protein n=1 Tax=Methylotenera sp. TaxID=2051956 RepID=UPI0024874E8A|nr:hypothetical protein [Methylotenera sp.]MDI1310065.1 hypothetical protein [Methylotenera sp.]
MQTLENGSTEISLPVTNTEDAPQSSYDLVRFNAMQHGILSRYTVLSHENAGEYQVLLSALLEEHQPAGMTEVHLVEELAGIIWRKRRVLQAEGANINQGLKGAAKNAESVVPSAAPFETGLTGKNTDLRDLVGMTPEEITESQRDTRHDLDATQKAAAILRRGGANAYDKALRALLPDSREWWQDYVDEEEYTATAEGLADFIREHIEPICIGMEKEARHHEAIKAQTLGEGLQVHRLEKLTRYETHLDRKFERTLAMILKLKELRSRG